MHPAEYFVVFPYLKTRNRVRLRGIELRSNQDLDDLPQEVQQRLRTLCNLFRLQEGVRINDMVCGYIPSAKDEDTQKSVLLDLQDVFLLINYLYAHPHPGGGIFLSSEHAALFLFTPAQVPTVLLYPGQQFGERVTVVGDRMEPNADLMDGYLDCNPFYPSGCPRRGGNLPVALYQ
jgi:hypothetical protein